MSGYLQNHLDTHEIPNMKFNFKVRTGKNRGPVGNNTLTYKCDICPDVYINEDEMVAHRRIAHKSDMKIIQKDPNSCKVCLLRFESQEELFKHTKVHHLLSSEDATQIEREIFVCEHCQVIFFNKQLLMFHIKYVHIKKGQFNFYKCPMCGRRKSSVTSWYHFYYHQLESISCCPICFDKCKDSKDLVYQHIRRHAKKVVCSTCGYVSMTLSEHTLHCTKHNKQDIKIEPDETNYKNYFVCNEMQKKTHNMRTIWWWQYLGCISGVKLPVGVGVCVFCKYIAASIEDMKRHVLVDHQLSQSTFIQEKKQVYQCMECDQQFCNVLLMKQHRLKGCKPPVTYWG